MNSKIESRAAIIVALRAGRTRMQIVNFLKLPISTVYKVAQKYYNQPVTTNSRRQIHNRSMTRKRNEEFINRLEELVQQDPSQSTRILASKLNVSATTIRRAIHEDLRCKSYRLKLHQMLSDNMKIKRLERSSLLLSSLKGKASGRIRLFSDEKIFCLDAKVNRQNDRWIVKDVKDVPVIGRTKHPSSVHVLMVISSEGHVMPPFFFEKGQAVNTEVYLNVLKDHVKPWIIKIVGNRPYVFQQDGAPAHTSRRVQDWMANNFDMFWSKDLWPPSSPDLNPLDYYLWSVLERESNKYSHNTIEALRTAISEAVTNISTDHVINACSRFRSRLEAVIEAKGEWIE